MHLGAIRFFYAVTFGKLEPTPVSVVNDIEQLCRKNVRKLFTESWARKSYQRDVALELFAPTIQDDPEC